MLHQIIANKKQEVARQKEAVPVSLLEKIVADQSRAALSFKQALLQSDTGIIAEFKRKSPSKGWLFADADVAGITATYEASGASALSVLTDHNYFGGSFDDLKVARRTVQLPLLRKDFMIDPYQVLQAKAMGADVILLIAAALQPSESLALSVLAKALGLEVLLEIHHASELDYIQPHIDVVGINNRNLATFVTDTEQSFRLGEQIPAGYLKISESGISNPQTVKDLRAAGFKGFLMGETFMKTSLPGETLAGFIRQLR